MLRRAHGADRQRAVAVAEAEALSFSVLPGDVRAFGPDGAVSALAVQPDARLASDRAAVEVEAKPGRKASQRQGRPGGQRRAPFFDGSEDVDR